MKGWKKTKLADIALKITKGTTPTTVGYKFVETGVNFIKAEALNQDVGLNVDSFAHITQEAHEVLKRSQLQPDDIVLTIAGANVGKVGKIRQKYLPANTNQAVGIIRVNNDLADCNYIYYILKNTGYNKKLIASTSQSAQPNINLTNIGNFEIALPPKKNKSHPDAERAGYW